MGEGNPGAISVLMQLFTESEKIDPDGIPQIGNILLLDTLKIYGSRIWMLYKDVCGEDLVKTIAMLRAFQLGYLPEVKLNIAIDNFGKDVDVDEMYKKVCEYLPNFKK